MLGFADTAKIVSAVGCVLVLGSLAMRSPSQSPSQITTMPASDALPTARLVVEEKLHESLRGGRLRAVVAYPQAIERTVAVCGQVNASGDRDDSFVPFVAVVAYPEGTPAVRDFVVQQQFVASTTSEATRTYLEMISRCLEGGGPKVVNGRRLREPIPPVPSMLPSTATPLPAAPPAGPAAAPALAPAPAAPGGASQALMSVSLRQHGNIRSAPQGAVTRVLPPGTQLKVFATAPGGWFQIGDGDQPIGWVHGSLLVP